MASKPPKLTMAQVYTLRRLASGTSYSLQGNGKKAHENREEIVVARGQWSRTTMPVNAPSIPVLFRLGLVEFIHPKSAITQPTHWHRVALTDTGLMIIKLTKDRRE